MADRADYLARTLTARLRNLEESFAGDGRAEPERPKRIEAIEKVLAIELGVTDAATIALIESAVPRAKSAERANDRELAAFAAFLRKHLAARLAEP